MKIVERFAPSPTGRLHLGHAFSALLAHDAAVAGEGQFLLRLEDLDRGRCRDGYVEGIFEDLAWLGLDWERPVLRQSDRIAAYEAALGQLAAAGLVYPCACSRRDIREAASAPQEGATMGPDGLVYPGTCRRRPPPAGAETALRLDMGAALRSLGARAEALAFYETGAGPDGQTGVIALEPDRLVRETGDVVLRRRDGAVAYHLAVVVDDAHQGVSHVTRGEDLSSATPIHRLLQALLGLATPLYRHHRLIRDETGRRLAKRDDARSLESLRAAGWRPADVRAAVGLAEA
ncbi:MAG: tRNA glutamyl-Q(34) synthetase GluQRS [Pseudomonadota bacterium]